jgi:hypothetical protein
MHESGNVWRPETKMKKLNVDTADDILNSTWPKRNTYKLNEKALREESQILIGLCKLH